MIAMLENGLDVRRVITHRFRADDYAGLRGDAVGQIGQGRARLDLRRRNGPSTARTAID
jgi:hypothetical protein